MDWKKSKKALRKAIKNTTPEELEKYFPKDTKPKGWINIEDHLPTFKAVDLLQGGTIYKVKNNMEEEFETIVADHNTWYYYAKEIGITHWWNE